MTILTYKISDYDSIQKLILDTNVLTKINTLAELYANVQNNDNSYNNNNKKKKPNGYYKRPQEVIIDPNFKATVILKREGFDKICSQIKACINKITPSNYSRLIQDIYEKMDDIMVDSNIEEEKDKIASILVSELPSVAFQSEINAKIFLDLMNKYSFLEKTVSMFIADYDEIITNISNITVNSDDYEAFCNNNKRNDLRKSKGLFMINIMRNKLLTKDFVINILKYFQDMLFKNIDEEGRENIVEEITENLYILLINGKSDLSGEKDWGAIINKISDITKLVVKDHASFTSRAKFKNMDILDNLKKISFARPNHV